MFKKIGSVFFILLIGAAGFFYWWQNRLFVKTDNAYVNAHVVQIAPRVTDSVTKLYVVNNQFIKKGETLLELDPTPFELAVVEAEAQLKKDQAQLDIAKLTAQRTAELVQKNVASRQEGDNAAAALRSALAAVQLSKTKLDQALVNLHYTKLIAPTNGWITNLSLQEGNTVAANQPLFALISNHEFWVDANFKETELTRIRPGQKAKIKFDMYPHRVFDGVVESISGGSGAVFSLLPPQNATGNWVKVTQRVPVRVRVLKPDDPEHPLRIGISANVSIDIS